MIILVAVMFFVLKKYIVRAGEGAVQE